MSVSDRVGLLKLVLSAAWAGMSAEVEEQSQLRRVAETLSPAAGENLALALRDIALQRLPLEEIAAGLARPELQSHAYELAVCVCNADSAHSDREHAFLEHLRVALALDVRTARTFERQADAIIGVPLQSDPGRVPAGAAYPVDTAQLDRLVESQAILEAALAARAQPLALLCTVPLQMKLIYRIGKAYGHELDREQTKRLMSALGIEPVSQYVESSGRMILAGVFDRPSIRLGREQAAVIAAIHFARMCALGDVARQVYGAPEEAPNSLHDAYGQAVGRARPSFEAHMPQIEARARQIAVNELIDVIKQQ
jgi:uncharacterized protein (DUF697 family)